MPGLGPGSPLLHPAVHRVQSGDPPSHLQLQAVHQHGRPHRPGQGAPLLPLLLHPLLGPSHHGHDGLLRLHHHHDLPEDKEEHPREAEMSKFRGKYEIWIVPELVLTRMISKYSE